MYVKPILAVGGVSIVLAGLLSALPQREKQGRAINAIKVVSPSAPPPLTTHPAVKTVTQTERSPPRSSTASTLDDADRRISPIISASSNLRENHDKLRSKGRDQEWAARSEKILSDDYNRLAGAREGLQSPRLVCGTTICELSGSFSGNAGEVKRTMQEPELAAKMWGLGYHNVGEVYGVGADGLSDYVVYYRREAPKTVKVSRLPPP